MPANRPLAGRSPEPVNGQPLDGARWVWASLVSAASITSGWHGWLTGENAITALGILVALLTVVERFYTIRIKRRQLRSPND